jgi:hypothetical protein
MRKHRGSFAIVSILCGGFTMANGNGGNGKWVYWLIGLVFPVATGTCAGVWHTLQSNSERIAVQESRVLQIGKQLERIEKKLDRLAVHDRWKPDDP